MTDTIKDQALAVFRRAPERLNCAQAVLYAHSEVSGKKTIPVADLKPFGGGRAPRGLCGALYAACLLVPDKAEALRAKFAEQMGSVRCKELRANREPAAELLQAELPG
jgi:hypothetical protein